MSGRDHGHYQTNGASLEDCHTNFFALVRPINNLKMKKCFVSRRMNY